MPTHRRLRHAAIPPRAALRELWRMLRTLYLLYGVLTTLYVVVRSAFEPSFFGSLDFAASLCHAATDIACALLWSPPVRRRFYGWLQSLVSVYDEDEATAGVDEGGGHHRPSHLANVLD